MRACESCKADISAGIACCPNCGCPVPVEKSADVKSHVHELIAEANILRIRRDYEASVEKCTEAIQLDPENPEIHSLLGDIYASQGNLREAARWYEISIDLRPECAIDVDKLEHVKTRLEELEAEAEAEAIEASQSKPERSAADMSLRYFIVTCAVAVGMFVFVGLRYFNNSASPEVRPIVRPNTTTPRPVGEAPPDMSIRPEEEQGLLNTLAQNEATGARHIHVDDVQLDPRKQTATITVTGPTPAGRPSRSSVLIDAATVAMAAFGASKSIHTLTVRTIIHLRGKKSAGEPQLVMVCDVGRALQSIKPEQAPAKAPPGAFRNVWWGPQAPE
jgi:hypothetical protein